MGGIRAADASPVSGHNGTQRVNGNGDLAFPMCLDEDQLERVEEFDTPTSHFYAGPEGLCLVEAVEVANTKIDLDGILQRVERKLIKYALDQTGGARASAARLMGISRSRLYRRIHALGLERRNAERPQPVPSVG